MAARIRKDDMVMVISGDHKGATGKVLQVLNDKDRVIVEGVNMVYRHVRRSRQNPQGGRVQKEAPIHMSNVQPVDPRTGRGTRVRFDVERDAAGHVVRKRRLSTGRKASGAVLSEVTRASQSQEGGQA
jgi:large subunit ribosomal protein L24